MRLLLHRLRVAVLPCCDLKTGAVCGFTGTRRAYYPRYWLFGLFPVLIGRKSARYRYDLAIRLIEKDRMK